MRLVAFSLALFALATLSFAQDQKPRTLDDIRLESYSVDQVEIRKALTDFFTPLKVHALISPRVQGVVTAELKKLPAEVVLQNILRQVNATFRVRYGVYEIVLKDTNRDGDDKALAAALNQYPERLSFNDDQAVYVLVNDSVTKYRKSDMKKLGAASLERAFPKETLDLTKEKDRSEFRRLARLADLESSIDPQTTGIVEIPETAANESAILNPLMKPFKSNYYVIGGEYMFFRPLSDYVRLQTVEFWPLPNAERKASLTWDRSYLYVTVGRWLYKVRKSDMKTVGFSEVAV